MDKELEKNNRESRLEKSREDKLLAFIGGKFIIYILLIVILLLPLITNLIVSLLKSANTIETSTIQVIDCLFK